LISRYDDRIVVINNNERYKEIISNRGLNYVRQFNSPTLRFPTQEEIATLTVLGHTWSIGDRFYKLAEKHYGETRLWWVIAWFNNAPTESHVELGQVVYIPTPLDRTLALLDV